MSPFKASDLKRHYTLDRAVSESEIIGFAEKLISRRFRKGKAITSPEMSQDYFYHRLAAMEHEVFSVLFLTNQNCIISYEEMFRGTIDSASVYPREVVKRGLQLNAAAVIFAHNHPSGEPEPSTSDNRITEKLVQALKLVDIRALDHIIVGGDRCVSLAERGLL